MMGSIISMSSCGAMMACFTCQNVTNCICKCFGISGTGNTAKQRSKLVYLFLMALSVVFAVVLQYSISPHLNIKGIWDIGCGQDDKKAIYVTEIDHCKGAAAVYRISFMGAIFYLFNAICTICYRNFHSNHWTLKIFLWIVLMGSSIFIPNTVFTTGYDWVSRTVSFLFLIAQIVILIDFSYSWNDNWVGKSDALELQNRSGKCYLIGLLSFSTIFYLVSIVGIVMMYLYFGHCRPLNAFISITLVGIIAFSYLQLFGDNEGSLLSSSIVALYCTWLCLSSITSYVDDPDTPKEKRCNVMTHTLDNTSSIIIGGIIAGISLSWTSFNQFRSLTKHQDAHELDNQYILDGEDGQDGQVVDNPSTGKHDNDLENNLPQENTEKDQILGEVTHSDSESVIDRRDPPPKLNQNKDKDNDNEKIYLFHLILMVASIYMAMLLTDWGTQTDTDDNVNITGGKTSMWVKISSQWITMMLYSWTLVVKRCFPDRDFS